MEVSWAGWQGWPLCCGIQHMDAATSLTLMCSLCTHIHTNTHISHTHTQTYPNTGSFQVGEHRHT